MSVVVFGRGAHPQLRSTRRVFPYRHSRHGRLSVIGASIRGPGRGIFAQFRQSVGQQLEAAALTATDQAGTLAGRQIQAAMRSAGLGKLANAIRTDSDLRKGGRIKRTGQGFSASGSVFVRGRNERTLGAVDAYLGGGADIRSRRGGWLWIATDNIPARAGRYRMTPMRYRSAGLESRIGPLVEVPGRSAGERLLIVERVTVSGRKGSARRMPKTGGVRRGRQARDVIVAFVGIKSTSRQARVDPTQILESVQAKLPELIAAALRS